MITAEVETINKQKALEYLALNHGNRPYRQPYTDGLAGRQQRGEWQTNGDTIRFDSEGLLRDGQHRLQMVVQTDVPIDVVVVRGIDPAAFITMDTGKKRILADVFTISGEQNPAELAAAIVWVRRYLVGSMTNPPVTHEQYIAILDQHPSLRDSVAFCLGLPKPAGCPGQPSITIATHYLFSRVDPDKANDFIERYVTGLRLDDANDPVARLRGQIIAYKSAKLKPTPQQVFGIFALAWNAYRIGRPQHQSFTTPIRGAQRPRIDGFPKKLLGAAQLPLEQTNEVEEG